MNLSWKIIIGVIITALMMFGIAVFWMLREMNSIDSLKFSDKLTFSEKVKMTDNWLNNLQKQNKFNGGVLLIKNDSVIIKNTYGFTDYTLKNALENNSSFRLASVSKQFTAVGIMLLKEQGKLDFDNPVTVFLPNLPYKNVTIRYLLNHTSGIPDVYMNFPTKYKDEIGGVLTISKVVELLVKENIPLKNTPNEIFEYNNTGYVLLAAIIEKVSSKSFENFMQTELFDKLNMKNTRVWNLVSKEKSFFGKTSSFENVLGMVTDLKPSVIDGVAGDGGIFSSINDFVIWNQFWYKNDLISTETKKQAFKAPVLNNGKRSNYGFGWTIVSPSSHWHNGSWLGARTLIVRNKELKSCLVILDNSSSCNVDKIANQIVKILK